MAEDLEGPIAALLTVLLASLTAAVFLHADVDVEPNRFSACSAALDLGEAVSAVPRYVPAGWSLTETYRHGAGADAYFTPPRPTRTSQPDATWFSVYGAVSPYWIQSEGWTVGGYGVRAATLNPAERDPDLEILLWRAGGGVAGVEFRGLPVPEARRIAESVERVGREEWQDFLQSARWIRSEFTGSTSGVSWRRTQRDPGGGSLPGDVTAGALLDVCVDSARIEMLAHLTDWGRQAVWAEHATADGQTWFLLVSGEPMDAVAIRAVDSESGEVLGEYRPRLLPLPGACEPWWSCAVVKVDTAYPVVDTRMATPADNDHGDGIDQVPVLEVVAITE
ncbi:MAG: hypothetical protein JJU45_13580 [Acidimicrobiia bacterium]|nr:hypothetical protein [Acidimicrobiia bacterium]